MVCENTNGPIRIQCAKRERDARDIRGMRSDASVAASNRDARDGGAHGVVRRVRGSFLKLVGR